MGRSYGGPHDEGRGRPPGDTIERRVFEERDQSIQPVAPPVKFHDARWSAGAVHRGVAGRVGVARHGAATRPTPSTAPGASACGYDWVKRKLRTGAVTSPFSISHTPLRVSPVTTSVRGSSTRVYQKSVTSSPRSTPADQRGGRGVDGRPVDLGGRRGRWRVGCASSARWRAIGPERRRRRTP